MVSHTRMLVLPHGVSGEIFSREPQSEQLKRTERAFRDSTTTGFSSAPLLRQAMPECFWQPLL